MGTNVINLHNPSKEQQRTSNKLYARRLCSSAVLPIKVLLRYSSSSFAQRTNSFDTLEQQSSGYFLQLCYRPLAPKSKAGLCSKQQIIKYTSSQDISGFHVILANELVQCFRPHPLAWL